MNRDPGFRRAGRRLLALFVITLALAPLLRPVHALGQTMFLDVNGNGIADGSDFWDFFDHDSSNVDVYLVTDHDFYGDPSYCQPPPGLNSYVVHLYCPQAAAHFSHIENRVEGMTEDFPAVVTDFGITVGYSRPTLLPPGKYLLFRVTVAPYGNLGCPELEIRQTSCFAPPGVSTSFGSQCVSSQGDNILRFGEDWGYATSVGGCTDFPGRTPAVTCPAAVTGRELETLRFPVSIFDPDCSIRSFTMYPRPAGVTFDGTNDFVAGVVGGSFVWTPARGQAGTYSIKFRAENYPSSFNPYWKYWDEESTLVTILPEQIIHPARVFTTPSNRVTRLPYGKPFSCFQLESADGSFDAVDIVPSSILLRYTSAACGDHEIAGTATRTVTIEDTDANGVAEFPACFSTSAWSALSPCLGTGTTVLPLELTASLANGDLVHGSISQSFVRTGPALASIAPNPVTPASAVEFTTSQRGFARVQVFDVQGRKVASTVDVSYLESGYHRFPLARPGVIDRMASGVYFVRVSTEHDGSETHAVMLVR